MKKKQQKRRKPGDPTYLRHKASGQAITIVRDGDGNRKQIYLGTWDSPKSHRRYREILGRYMAGLPIEEIAAEGPEDSSGGTSVEELVARFLDWAEGHFVKDGEPTGETANYSYACKPLLKLCRDLPAVEFDQELLEEVRREMVSSGLCRPEINKRVRKLRRVFKWGAQKKLVPSSVDRLYAYRSLMFETFVHADLHKGTCYRAANWVSVSETQGRGKMDREHTARIPQKLVFLHPLARSARSALGAESQLDDP